MAMHSQTTSSVNPAYTSTAHPLSTMGAHTHTITNHSTYYQNMVVQVGHSTCTLTSVTNEDLVHIDKEGNIKLTEVDSLPVFELLNTFKYIQEEYPRVYADLILRGIIK